jgi:hypothetical protein
MEVAMPAPQFCPNPSCTFHIPRKDDNIGPVFWAPFGSYQTKVAGKVRRFRCTSCGRTFGERTFRLDYYAKKTLDYREIHRSISSSESVSAIAKAHHCSVASIQNRLDRLSRNGILFHSACLDSLVLKEGLTADGFESFDRSQFFPNNINLLLGTDSQFLYGVTHTTLRRKGRMTEDQKDTRERLEKLYRPPRGAFVNSFLGLISEIPHYWDPATLPHLDFRTDEHKLYPCALERNARLAAAIAEGTLSHRTWSSLLPRTFLNPLFSANYYDRELRKDIAAFHRESTCFTRNAANGMNRFVCHMIYHNYQKDWRIKWGVDRTPVHAVVAGIDAGRIKEGLAVLFTERLFHTHQTVRPIWNRIWCRTYMTPLKVRDEYLPKYAKIGA